MKDDLAQYSKFTQVVVSAWRRSLTTYPIGPTQVPWLVLWFIVTGVLLVIGNLGFTLALTIFLGSLLAATFPHKNVVGA